MRLQIGNLPSPLGELLVVTDEQQFVRALDYADHRPRLFRLLQEHYASCKVSEAPVPPGIATALQGYFDGDLQALDAIATATNGSELERRVWSALRNLPAGETVSYSEIARGLGLHDPRAAIEIGAINGANPVAIIVPCHRVIAKNGNLKGYAGGQHRKRWLLQHEGAMVKPVQAPEVLRLPGM
jgi:methylated-DNA-[protein]-cysteine S-methyltransferase